MKIIIKSKTSINTWIYEQITALSYNAETNEITFTTGGNSKTVKLSENWIIIQDM